MCQTLSHACGPRNSKVNLAAAHTSPSARRLPQGRGAAAKYGISRSLPRQNARAMKAARQRAKFGEICTRTRIAHMSLHCVFGYGAPCVLQRGAQQITLEIRGYAVQKNVLKGLLRSAENVLKGLLQHHLHHISPVRRLPLCARMHAGAALTLAIAPPATRGDRAARSARSSAQTTAPRALRAHLRRRVHSAVCGTMPCLTVVSMPASHRTTPQWPPSRTRTSLRPRRSMTI